MCIGFAGCLALRTRSGSLKNSFNPGGTLPTHPVREREREREKGGGGGGRERD